MNNTKKLTEAALLSSLFVVCTIVAVGTGIGYSLYLDFIVPVFLCIICLKCGFKYTVLSGVTSVLIVGLVLGDIGTAIWITQSIVLGIMCGILLNKPTAIMDDLVYASILGVLLMVLIDVYASALIGYSFMKEFQEYVKLFPYKNWTDIIYYLFIATLPFGTVFTVYYVSLIVGKRLKIVQGEAKKKLEIMSNFRRYSRFLCCSKKVFYSCAMYIFLVEIMNILNINVESVYLKTVIISIEYLCMYFVIRDGYVTIQNYVLAKFEKISYARILLLIFVVLLIILYRITIGIIVILNIILDNKIDIRTRQSNIINGLLK
ncbi:DUF2232 domain-containing protein [Romboutsia sp.]|uniref:DUF2232 domain-containing protein n=1 Tax=Romboutsia sp. TaxID=1965302 RepID=UPI003F3D9319